MKPLTADECNEFIRKQFPNNKKHMAETIINKISASPSNSYSQLLNTPINFNKGSPKRNKCSCHPTNTCREDKIYF